MSNHKEPCEGSLILRRIFEDLKDVHDVDSFQVTKRNVAVRVLETAMRTWMVQGRYQKFSRMLRTLRQCNCRVLFHGVSTNLSRCNVLDLSIDRVRRRQSRKTLYRYWLVLCAVGHASCSSTPRHKMTTISLLSRLTRLKIISLQRRAFQNWQSIQFSPLRLSSKQIMDATALADVAIQTALLAFQHACSIKSRRQDKVDRVLSIVKRCWDTETSLLQTVFVCWREWSKSSGGGRLALQVIPDYCQGAHSFSVIPSKPTVHASFKSRFDSVYDLHAAKRISRGFRLRKYVRAWHSQVATLGVLTRHRRAFITRHIQNQLSSWRLYANKLRVARQSALNRWCAHVAARTAGPLRAWYVWTYTRRIQKQAAGRVVLMFTRLKHRQVTAATLRAWRHTAELNRLEARYTRRQLMGALAEQKSHIRRLEQSVDDHDLVRAQLEGAVEVANERAAKLVRYAAARDDDCKLLEDHLATAEAGVTEAQHCLLAVEAIRSALTQHVLQTQPAVGFIDRDMTYLARNRGARLGAGMETPMETKGSELAAANVASREVRSPDNTSTIENQDEAFELPRGLVLIFHPNTSCGLLLCRCTSQGLQRMSKRADVIKAAMLSRLDWLVRATNQRFPVIDFRETSRVVNSLLFKGDVSQAKGRCADELGFAVPLFDTIGPRKSFMSLPGMTHKMVDEVALKLLCSLREMYGVFEFLRDGDASALCSRLKESWDAYWQSKNNPTKTWREIATSPECVTWTDLLQHLNSRMPHRRLNETDAEKLAFELVSSQTIYTGSARHRRSIYSRPPPRLRFQPELLQMWDST